MPCSRMGVASNSPACQCTTVIAILSVVTMRGGSSAALHPQQHRSKRKARAHACFSARHLLRQRRVIDR
jgi:hypothetical protein